MRLADLRRSTAVSTSMPVVYSTTQAPSTTRFLLVSLDTGTEARTLTTSLTLADLPSHVLPTLALLRVLTPLFLPSLLLRLPTTTVVQQCPMLEHSFLLRHLLTSTVGDRTLSSLLSSSLTDRIVSQSVKDHTSHGFSLTSHTQEAPMRVSMCTRLRSGPRSISPAARATSRELITQHFSLSSRMLPLREQRPPRCASTLQTTTF